jgi:hypothetical protein
MNRLSAAISVGVMGLLSISSPVWAQAIAPSLGTADQFAVLGGSAVRGATGGGVGDADHRRVNHGVD